MEQHLDATRPSNHRPSCVVFNCVILEAPQRRDPPFGGADAQIPPAISVRGALRTPTVASTALPI